MISSYFLGCCSNWVFFGGCTSWLILCVLGGPLNNKIFVSFALFGMWNLWRMEERDMVLTPSSAALVTRWSAWLTFRTRAGLRVFSQGLQRNKRHKVANSFSPLTSLLQTVVQCIGLIIENSGSHLPSDHISLLQGNGVCLLTIFLSGGCGISVWSSEQVCSA